MSSYQELASKFYSLVDYNIELANKKIEKLENSANKCTNDCS